MFHFLDSNLESLDSFNELMLSFVTINESKEKLQIVFCCFLAVRNITAPSSFSNFPMKLIC